MRCSKCGAENRETAKFCDGCGTPIQARCVSCGTFNRAGARFCDGCGTALSGQPPSSVQSARAPEERIRVTPEQAEAGDLDGERKTVTALFADIKGSMELIEDLDPEEARAIVDPALKLMFDAVHRYGGYVAQSTGDGIFALFGAPIAHEDHPQRALYSAIRIQEDIKRHAEKLRAEKGVNLQVRVGVNTGEVVVRSIKTGGAHTEYAPIGHSISLASRLQALAGPGSIAISGAVRRLAEGYFTMKALGPARIKGVSEPVEVYEVTGLGPIRTRLQRAAGRGLAKFVGRQREMDAMKHAAEQAKTGHGQIVAALGEDISDEEPSNLGKHYREVPFLQRDHRIAVRVIDLRPPFISFPRWEYCSRDFHRSSRNHHRTAHALKSILNRVQPARMPKALLQFVAYENWFEAIGVSVNKEFKDDP